MRRSLSTPVLAVLLLGALAAVLTYVFPFRQIIAQQRAVAQAEESLAVLRSENDRLEAEVAALQTPTEVERMAREQFGLVMPGEVAYVVVSPPDEFLERDQTQVAAEPEDPAARVLPPWAQKAWDFLTGRDLVP